MFGKILAIPPLSHLLHALYRGIRNGYESHMERKYKEKYKIHDTFEFQSRHDKLPVLVGDGCINIGKAGHIASHSLIESVDGTEVDIGNYVRIGSNVRMRTANYNSDQSFSQEDEHIELETGDIAIGDGVFIGSNVFIKHGITIGENAAVGANSVVTTDVPPNTTVGGVPAKEIGDK